MDKNKWIEDVRHYLDEPQMVGLHDKAMNTRDLSELRELLLRARSLMRSYVEDANSFIEILNDEKFFGEKVLICTECKSIWIAPVEKCVCGCGVLEETHWTNRIYAKNYK
jgi:hypothetical protein